MSVTLYEAGTTLKDIMDMKVGEGLKVGSDIPDFDETNVGNVLRVMPGKGDEPELAWDVPCYTFGFTTGESEVTADFELSELHDAINYGIPFVFSLDGSYYSKLYIYEEYEGGVDNFLVYFIQYNDAGIILKTVYYIEEDDKFMLSELDFFGD